MCIRDSVSNNGKFAVVHNGIIENYSALREELTARGCVFLSETDTEVVVHLLETCYTGDVKQALMRTAARLEGSYALGILCTDAPGKLYALREASPLILGLGAGENYFASDVTALVAHTRNAVFLEDGQFAELTAEGVTVFDGAGRPIDAPVTRIEWSLSLIHISAAGLADAGRIVHGPEVRHGQELPHGAVEFFRGRDNKDAVAALPEHHVRSPPFSLDAASQRRK